MNCKQLAIFLIILSSISSFCQKNRLFFHYLDWKYPKNQNEFNVNNAGTEPFDEMVIVSLRNPEDIWKNEVSAMSEKDVSNLKVVMKYYVAMI